ncbi:MAG: 4a-hydroxytetrahydrobiopterin dehydratase [bacterium]|nr:4a-hydroxytetrahydrobiopterin dehydratase [bacterium]
MTLREKHCVPCEGGTVPLFRSRVDELLKEVQGWSLSPDGKSISKTVKFKDFLEAMEFANKITPIAEAEGHHPDLTISWGKVGIELSTHAISGLSENDFILAAKIDQLRQ